MKKRATYPFTAIVGQEEMKTALLLSIVMPSLGGVLIKGEKGTAKSTAVRAAAALLPDLHAVRGCACHCDPARPELYCDACQERSAEGKLPQEEVPMCVVELPVSATEDRVVGTLDMEAAIQHGRKAFEPGILAAANRNILYVDEINLLEDHIVDILLDSAAMGVNTVEREGISYAHPARFVLIGTMNPEEGDIRPQLLDRFALSVTVAGEQDAESRVEVIRRRIAYERDADAFAATYAAEQEQLRTQIVTARRRPMTFLGWRRRSRWRSALMGIVPILPSSRQGLRTRHLPDEQLSRQRICCASADWSSHTVCVVVPSRKRRSTGARWMRS